MPAPPKKAFVLAAGIGTRMRPLTDNCPKPLLVVDGRSMLDRALDALVEAGVEEAVVNTHYLGEMIAAHLKTRTQPRITLSPEPELLDTAGGVKKNLAFFGDDPFYVLNADVLWTDGRAPTLKAMADKWNGATMDLLILLQATADIPAYAEGKNGLAPERRGDYYLAKGSDRPVFAKNTDHDANTVFAGPRIVHPRLFKDTPDGKFGFLQLFHKAEKAGRLAALLHDGEWHHVGTPEAFAETNLIFAKKKAG